MDVIKKIGQEEIKNILLTVGLTILKSKNPLEKNDVLKIATCAQNYFIKGNCRLENHAHIGRYSQDQTVERSGSHVLNEQEAVTNCYQSLIHEDDSDEWFGNLFKNPIKKNKSAITTPTICEKAQEISHHILCENDENNIKFIENIVSVYDEIEKKSPHFPSELHKVLYDEAEHASKIFHLREKDPVRNEQLSEDSGVFSENSSEHSKNIKVVPGVSRKTVLGPVNSNTNPLNSFTSILENIKAQVKINTDEIVLNWKNSLVEHNCSIICSLSLKDALYETILQNFIVDFLNEIWSDGKMDQHANWKKKIQIICCFLTTPNICLEVLFFTIDVFNNIKTTIEKKCYSSLVIVKAALFLEMYPIVARTLNLLLEPPHKTKLHETTSVTKLWQEKLSCFTSVDNNHQDVRKVIKVDIIPKLVGFLTCTINKEPLISLAIKEAMELLINLCDESDVSQEYIKNLY